MIPHLETNALSSPAPKAKAHTLTERYPLKVRAVEERALQEQEAEFRAEISLDESVEFLGTLPCVSMTRLNQDANMATNADSNTLRLMCSPEKVEEKWCERFSALMILLRENRFTGRKEKWDQIAPTNSPKGTWHHIKIREREGPSRGAVWKCEPHESNPCAPRFEERTQDETLHQEGCARRVASDLAKSVYRLKNTDKSCVLLSY